MLRSSFVLVLVTTVGLGFGCASGGGGGGAAADAAAEQMQVPSDSPLAKIELGMSDEEVRSILGSPDDSNAYMTGKQFIPFYYGPDTRRTDWLYRGQGRVVFSRNAYSGGLKVIRVLYDPDDTL
jgi:hypothetical protein